jgi:hypothetical protein
VIFRLGTEKLLTFFTVYIPELALKNGLGHINISLPLLLLIFPLFSALLPVFAVKVQ